jgi:hypothetical protein
MMVEPVEPAGSEPVDGVDIQGLIDQARADGLSLAGPDGLLSRVIHGTGIAALCLRPDPAVSDPTLLGLPPGTPPFFVLTVLVGGAATVPAVSLAARDRIAWLTLDVHGRGVARVLGMSPNSPVEARRDGVRYRPNRGALLASRLSILYPPAGRPGRRTVAVWEITIWEDPAAAARPLTAAGGNETVPTVIIGS